MLGLKLIHVSKKGPQVGSITNPLVLIPRPQCYCVISVSVREVWSNCVGIYASFPSAHIGMGCKYHWQMTSCSTIGSLFAMLSTGSGHNGHKPKRPKPKRPQTETATNRNGHKPERPQTETATNRNGHRPERPQTGTATNRNGHKPKRPQTGTATNRNRHN